MDGRHGLFSCITTIRSGHRHEACVVWLAETAICDSNFSCMPGITFVGNRDGVGDGSRSRDLRWACFGDAQIRLTGTGRIAAFRRFRGA
ncbi:MAG: hypothetical protein WC112_09530 [Proteiniphilum sp.]